MDLNIVIIINFSIVVNLNKGGDYIVVLNFENEDGVKVEMVYVIVIVDKDLVLIISVKIDIIYDKFFKKIEVVFLDDIDVDINDGFIIIFNFVIVVNLDKVGDYIVILNFINSDGVVFMLIVIIVYVEKEKIVMISVNMV